jgi:hypothetical protein
VLRQVAEGVLVHQSEFCQSNAVVVQGRTGVLLIDPGVLGYEMACLANDLGELGSVHYAYDSATNTYWALANFAPSATAPPRVTVSFQDGTSWGFFTKVGSGPWLAQEGGEPVVCLEVGFFPRAVLTAWSLPTDTASFGC